MFIFGGRRGIITCFFSAGACCKSSRGVQIQPICLHAGKSGGYDTDKPASGLEYSIRVCRSTSVSGPFVDANGVWCTAGGGTIVLASHDYVYGPGGQGIFVDTTYGGAVLYYHYGMSSPFFFLGECGL